MWSVHQKRLKSLGWEGVYGCEMVLASEHSVSVWNYYILNINIIMKCVFTVIATSPMKKKGAVLKWHLKINRVNF